MPRVAKLVYVCDICKKEELGHQEALASWLGMAGDVNVLVCPECREAISKRHEKPLSCKTIWASRDTCSTHIYLWKEEPKSRISHGDVSFYGAVFSFLQSEDTLQSFGITIEPGTKIKLRISVEVES